MGLSIEEISSLQSEVARLEQQVATLRDALESVLPPHLDTWILGAKYLQACKMLQAALAATPPAEESDEHDNKCERVPQPSDNFERLAICLCSERADPQQSETADELGTIDCTCPVNEDEPKDDKCPIHRFGPPAAKEPVPHSMGTVPHFTADSPEEGKR